MRQINRLLFFYLFALSILLISVATSLVITDRLAQQLENDAAKINMSGRQRMLSQRIIYLAQDLTYEPAADTRAKLEKTITEFKAGIELFAGSHDRLSGALGIEPALKSLYFSAWPARLRKRPPTRTALPPLNKLNGAVCCVILTPSSRKSRQSRWPRSTPCVRSSLSHWWWPSSSWCWKSRWSSCPVIG